MKRLLFTIVTTMFCASLFAQNYDYGIDPVTYTPMPRTLPTYDLPEYDFSLDVPKINSYSNNSTVTVSSKKTVSVSAFELESCNVYDVQVTITEYSNGNVKFVCCGIKQNETWIPITADVLSLQKLYDKCTNNDNETKSVVLSLMEYADFIMQYKGKTYLL